MNLTLVETRRALEQRVRGPTEGRPLDLTPQELGRLRSAGLTPRQISRLCFAKWRFEHNYKFHC